jgi:uncharacterized protein (DUF4213/DUF364 family)
MLMLLKTIIYELKTDCINFDICLPYTPIFVSNNDRQWSNINHKNFETISERKSTRNNFNLGRVFNVI